MNYRRTLPHLLQIHNSIRRCIWWISAHRNSCVGKEIPSSSSPACMAVHLVDRPDRFHRRPCVHLAFAWDCLPDAWHSNHHDWVHVRILYRNVPMSSNCHQYRLVARHAFVDHRFPIRCLAHEHRQSHESSDQTVAERDAVQWLKYHVNNVHHNRHILRSLADALCLLPGHHYFFASSIVCYCHLFVMSLSRKFGVRRRK